MNLQKMARIMYNTHRDFQSNFMV